MKKFYLENGIKIIYEYRNTNLTSFCISLDAGAVREDEKLGLAHVTEHMVFKGTSTKNELEINTLCDKYFGFNNAMTNYPYVIYYGTALNEDLDNAFMVYSDILVNPSFKEEGFQQEMNVIKEELQEWSEDNDQHCEDLLYKNSFSKRRIKELIIGNEETLNGIKLSDIKEFYNKFYVPSNCVIAFVTSLSEKEVLDISRKYLENWNKTPSTIHKPYYETNKPGVFIDNKVFSGSKIQYSFPIHHLNQKEMKALRLFDAYFAQGTSSKLYHNIRTLKGFAYDVSSAIRYERDIKTYNLYVSTSTKNIDDVVEVIDRLIKNSKEELIIDNERLKDIRKSFMVKRELFIEKSIQLAKELSTYETMFDNCEIFYEEVQELDCITREDIIKVVNKVFNNATIEILRGHD
ncbi:M16 family metallopeptidase [Clostridium cellulovorans]|uniref:Peptidase M16 domain protein n=1 Tax=Clostridium cellulovorans (strain ATCC 35296 / DSM 3052 / OCM 3 / 743B) TaxID=573061 RepID=D9SPV4_CLOC7|nr:pitrilysin family protein [Clostridium cellulovorans]ADL52090.1 peptidase M16 domain protein [Clostridium cellulovorans 743B]